MGTIPVQSRLGSEALNATSPPKPEGEELQRKTLSPWSDGVPKLPTAPSTSEPSNDTPMSLPMKRFRRAFPKPWRGTAIAYALEPSVSEDREIWEKVLSEISS